MKALLVLFISFILARTALATCDDSHKESTKKEAKMSTAKKYTQEILIEGMTCGRCIKIVQKEIDKIPVSEGVKFLVNLNQVILDYSANAGLKPEDVDNLIKLAKVAIEKANYKVVGAVGIN